MEARDFCYQDTYARQYDAEKLQEYGIAMLASQNIHKEDLQDTTSSLTPLLLWNSGVGTSFHHRLVSWLSFDYERNSSLLGLLVSDVSNCRVIDPECVIEARHISEYSFQSDVNNLMSDLGNLKLLDMQETSLQLARQIANMPRDDMDVEEWAEIIARDISSADD